MSKWYRKTIYTVTGKNFVSILLLSMTVLVYVIEKVIGSEVNYTQFMIGLFLGQQIGYSIARMKRK